MARNRELTFYQAKKKRKWPFVLWFFAFLILTVGVVFLVNVTINSQLKAENIKVPVLGLPKDLEGFTILHISDIHGSSLGGTGEKTLLEALKNNVFHAVCITGDVVDKNGNTDTVLSIIASIKAANAAVPVYFVPGDEDPPPISASSSSGHAPYLEKMIQAGVTYVDVPVLQEVKKTRVWFTPKSQYSMDPDILSSSYSSQQSSKASSFNEGSSTLNYYTNQLQRLKTARKTMKVDDYQVILTHNPLHQNEFSTWLTTVPDSSGPLSGIVLSLAGHYNGGQWRLPFTDQPIYVPEKGFFPASNGLVGLEQVGSITQYISPGIGASSYYPLPGRLFNPPTITFITLTGKAL